MSCSVATGNLSSLLTQSQLAVQVSRAGFTDYCTLHTRLEMAGGEERQQILSASGTVRGIRSGVWDCVIFSCAATLYFNPLFYSFFLSFFLVCETPNKTEKTKVDKTKTTKSSQK